MFNYSYRKSVAISAVRSLLYAVYRILQAYHFAGFELIPPCFVWCKTGYSFNKTNRLLFVCLFCCSPSLRYHLAFIPDTVKNFCTKN